MERFTSQASINMKNHIGHEAIMIASTSRTFLGFVFFFNGTPPNATPLPQEIRPYLLCKTPIKGLSTIILDLLFGQILFFKRIGSDGMKITMKKHRHLRENICWRFAFLHSHRTVRGESQISKFFLMRFSTFFGCEELP